MWGFFYCICTVQVNATPSTQLVSACLFFLCSHVPDASCLHVTILLFTVFSELFCVQQQLPRFQHPPALQRQQVLCVCVCVCGLFFVVVIFCPGTSGGSFGMTVGVKASTG